MPTTKSEIREEMLALRTSQAPPANSARSEKICQRALGVIDGLRPSTTFIYLSTAEEVSTFALIEALLERDIKLVVPKILGRQHMAAVDFPGWSGMRPGPLGILAPDQDKPTQSAIDIAIVPGLAFGMGGERLGFGAGYYDRWFSSQASMTKCALAFDFQIRSDIPIDQHDVPMNLIVTETRLLNCSNSQE